MTFAPIKREAIPLLLGVAGGTGSGKTYSALLLARGIAQGHPIAGIDTENGRMSHYADLFPEVHADRLTAPFRPDRYTAKIDEAVSYLEQQGVPKENRVVLVDSMSHEWTGDGGCLEWQEELMDGKEANRQQSWIKPKRAHKKMMTHLTQLPCHVVLAFRAEEKNELVDDPKRPGKKIYVPKRTLPGGSLDGWLPLTEKNVAYELTASFLLMADRPGVPRPIRLQEQHKPFVPLDAPLTEKVGRQLAAWAAGSAGEPKSVDALVVAPDVASDGDVSQTTDGESASPADAILELAARIIDAKPEAAEAIEQHSASHEPAEHLAWLRRQASRLVTA